MPNVKLASLAVSRIEPRPATNERDALPAITIAPGATVLLLPVNVNRTASTIENTSASDAVYVGYGAASNAQAPNGFKLPQQAAYDIDTPQEVWANNRSLNPVTINLDEGQG